jgi:hypothetical protein
MATGSVSNYMIDKPVTAITMTFCGQYDFKNHTYHPKQKFALL